MSVMRSRQQKLSEKADEERMLRLAAAIYARQSFEVLAMAELREATLRELNVSKNSF
jgi:hypothetical protein